MFNGKKLDTIATTLNEIKDLLEKDIAYRGLSLLPKDVSKISDTLKTIQIDVDTVKLKTGFHSKKEAV